MTEAIRQNKDILPEKTGLRQKASRLSGRVAVAAICTLPFADLALSDAWTAKQYEVVTEKVEMANKLHESGAENSILAALGIAETIALGQVVSRNKKIRNAFSEFDEYSEERRAKMGPVKRVASKVVNAPFMALKKVAEGFEAAGEKLSERKSAVARHLGKVAIETGQVNIMGTSGMILQETMADRPPSVGRQAYLGSLIMGTWLGAAEGIRQVYRNVPITRPPLATVGRVYETLTTMDITSPLSTPVGSIAISSAAIALAYTGWKLEEFRQQREQLTNVNMSQVHGLSE